MPTIREYSTPADTYRLASFRNAILWRPTRRPRTEAKSPVKATPDYGMTDPKRVYDVIGERELSTLYGRPQSFAGCPEAAVRLQGRDPGHTLALLWQIAFKVAGRGRPHSTGIAAVVAG
jgi:hypothetical protein